MSTTAAVANERRALPSFTKYRLDTAIDPEWLATPDDIEYELLMSDSGGETVQQIDITRAEYIALKRHLAELRGLHV